MRFTRTLFKVAAALALTAASGAASAALITFDFAGGGPNASTIIVNEGGSSLRVDGFIGNTPSTISWTGSGLGVVGNGSNQLNPGAFTFEELEFYLPLNSVWVGATLSNFATGEDVSFCSSVAGTNSCSGNFTTVFGGPGIDAVSLAALGSSPTFSFFSNPGGSNNGSLRIRSITVDVPASGSFALLGLGLLALGLNRRHAKR